MKNILVIGGGSIGKRHTRNLLSLGEKNITLVEPSEERVAAIVSELGVKVVPSIEAAWAINKFDIAFVCSPSIYHLEQALVCAERGCDLFIEKPLSHITDGQDRLVSLIGERRLVTMVGSNWKFYPLFQTMKELLDRGTIGRVLSARCQFGQYLPDWHPEEDYRRGYSANNHLGGGILLDSHEFDYLTWFIGEPVKKLACFANRVSNLEIDVEDTAEVILQFVNGTIGEIHLDYTQRFYQRNFEFFGAEGTIWWDTNWKKIVLRTVETPGSGVLGSGSMQEFPLATDYDINTMYVEEVRHFLDCVEHRQETITPVSKGADVVKLICAAKAAATMNCVIQLS